MKATDVIRRDHEAAKAMFDTYRELPEEEQGDFEVKILDALDAHEKMEDEYFFPALKDLMGDDEMFKHLDREQTELKMGVLALRAMALFDRRKKMIETMEKVVHHAEEEESSLLPRAEELLSAEALEEIGSKMEPESAVAKSE